MNRYVLMIFCAAIASPAFAQPQMRLLGNTICDFDTIYQGEKREAIFEIMNIWNQPLLVWNIESSRGCTASLMSVDLFSPNSTAWLVASFDFESRPFVPVFLVVVFLPPIFSHTLRDRCESRLTCCTRKLFVLSLSGGAAVRSMS